MPYNTNNKLLFSKRTSLVKGDSPIRGDVIADDRGVCRLRRARGTIAILAMVEGFIIKIFVIKERIPQSFLTASG